MQPLLSDMAARGMVGAPPDAAVDPYWYSTPLRDLGAAAVDAFSVPIQENAVFILCGLSGILMDDPIVAPGPLVDGNFTAAASLLLTDTGSARQLMDRPLWWHSVVGTAQRPHWLPTPKPFAQNATIQVQVTELVPAGNASLYQLVFIGVKVYKAMRQ